MRVTSGGEQAVIVGHLAVSALHLATGECPPEHMDPAGANTALEKLLAEDAVLIGPLWPAPGAGRWNGQELVPVFVTRYVRRGARSIATGKRGRAPSGEVVAVRVLVVHERARELVLVRCPR